MTCPEELPMGTTWCMAWHHAGVGLADSRRPLECEILLSVVQNGLPVWS
jgi:hypothetical protein